jgi:hypothetical protein
MSDTVTFARITGMETGPAVWSEGWLPDIDAFPELTEAREKRERLHVEWQAAGERARDLDGRIEANAQQRKTALRDAYLAGEADPEAEGGGEALTAELAAAKEHSQAAMTAYVEHLNSCIALVVERGQEWQDEITAFQQNVDSDVQALLRQAEALRAKRGNYGRLEHWIQRTVSGATFPADHFPYADIPAPPSGDVAEEEARAMAFMERSYAGSPTAERRATEAEGRDLEQRNVASQRRTPRAPGDEVEVELSHLDDGELVDWLMSCGMFDGNPKPAAALVIEAAEGDAEMAERLLQAERTAGGDAVRRDVLDALTEITNGKATA